MAPRPAMARETPMTWRRLGRSPSDDGERDREHRLKRCDHRRKPGRQPVVHRHEENPELPDTDERTDGDNRRQRTSGRGTKKIAGKALTPKRRAAKRSGGNDSRPMS